MCFDEGEESGEGKDGSAASDELQEPLLDYKETSVDSGRNGKMIRARKKLVSITAFPFLCVKVVEFGIDSFGCGHRSLRIGKCS